MTPSRSFFEILSLCLKSCCPVCAEGRLFHRWSEVRGLSALLLPREKCDVCSFCFAREPGYYLGVVMPTLSILSVGTGVLFAAVTFLCVGPQISEIVQYGAMGVLGGLLFWFRTAVAVFIAFDHSIDPPRKQSS